MTEELPVSPPARQTKGWAYVIATVVFAVATLAIFLYLFAVVYGKISKDSRLGTSEVGLGIVACLALILVIHPSALDRLNLLKLPGGIEVTLEKNSKSTG